MNLLLLGVDNCLECTACRSRALRTTGTNRNLWHQNQVGVQISHLGFFSHHVDAKWFVTQSHLIPLTFIYHDVDKLIVSGPVGPVERPLGNRYNMLPWLSRQSIFYWSWQLVSDWLCKPLKVILTELYFFIQEILFWQLLLIWSIFVQYILSLFQPVTYI